MHFNAPLNKFTDSLQYHFSGHMVSVILGRLLTRVCACIHQALQRHAGWPNTAQKNTNLCLKLTPGSFPEPNHDLTTGNILGTSEMTPGKTQILKKNTPGGGKGETQRLSKMNMH